MSHDIPIIKAQLLARVAHDMDARLLLRNLLRLEDICKRNPTHVNISHLHSIISVATLKVSDGAVNCFSIASHSDAKGDALTNSLMRVM